MLHDIFQQYYIGVKKNSHGTYILASSVSSNIWELLISCNISWDEGIDAHYCEQINTSVLRDFSMAPGCPKKSPSTALCNLWH